MGVLDFAAKDGSFKRAPSLFRKAIQKTGEHPPESNRYILYISLACPWAHRTLIARGLKGLESIIKLSIVDYLMEENGWKFSSAEETPGCIPDPLYNCKYIKDLYFKSDPQYSGRFTVPVLWDSKSQTIVNNESGDILRIFNTAFETKGVDLYPEELRDKIDEWNDRIYQSLNNGVYRAGFATDQSVYETNAKEVADGLKEVEKLLEESQKNGLKFMFSNELTETDIRLFTTMIRFDPVYFGHFKCNLLAVKDCPSLMTWLERVYNHEAVKSTVNMVHIKRHYYMSHKQINPTQIVPLYDGPIRLD